MSCGLSYAKSGLVVVMAHNDPSPLLNRRRHLTHKFLNKKKKLKNEKPQM